MDHRHRDALPRMRLCQPSMSCTFTRFKDGHLAWAYRWKRANRGWDAFRGAVALAEHCTSAPLTLRLPGAMLNCRTHCGAGDSPAAAVASAPMSRGPNGLRVEPANVASEWFTPVPSMPFLLTGPASPLGKSSTPACQDNCAHPN
jgi:hypothetical protein